MRARDAIVVGAGHNGLVCAALLARAGLDVLVLERRELAGGAAATEELLPGHRFSTCAYVVHLLEPAVLEALGIAEDELRLAPLPARVVVSRGRVLEDEEPEEWAAVGEVLAPFSLRDAPTEDELLAEARRRGRGELVERFARLSLDELGLAGELAPPYYEADPAERGGPLAYAWTKRPAAAAGVPEGGMATVAAAFERAAREAGAELRFGSTVQRLAGDGVVVDGEEVGAAVVVSSLDPATTLRLAGEEPPQWPSGPAGAKLHLALAGEPDLSLLGPPDELGLVHVVPGPDWLRRALADACEGRWPEHALVELQLPTLRDRSLAPQGRHCLSVFLPHAPPRLREGGWDARRADLAELLLRRAAEAIPNLRDLVDGGVVHTPDDLERRLGLPGGAIHHLPHVPACMGSARPGPRTHVPGLFLCGAGTHPGGELSGAPGANAARAVLAER
ncbi:MAG TPA: NAD(P)/FAD-dependent oxidoreductase [Gaiellaceae bacterium]|nr:NAD(P)/FAD-dependent oxidoreductase [Gaiellaceae bacterium]